MKNNEFRRLSGLDRQSGFDGYQPSPDTTRVLQRGLDAPLPVSMQEAHKQLDQRYFDGHLAEAKPEGTAEFPKADRELEGALAKMHNTAAEELASVLGQYADGPPLKGGWQASVAVKVDGDHRIYASIGDQYAPKPGVYEAIWGIQSGLGDKKDQDAYDLLWPSLVGLKDKLKKYGKVEDDRHHGSLMAKVWLRMDEVQARRYLGDMKALAGWWARSLSSRVEQAEREAAMDKEMATEAATVAESVSRYCEFWKADNGKWYLDLASQEHGDAEDATTYGPFSSEAAAEKYLDDNFSNPGGSDTDDSGTRPAPTKSPNGDPVRAPKSARAMSSTMRRW